MDYYAAISDEVSTPASSWVSFAPFEPEKQAQKALSNRTAFSRTASGIIDFFIDAKGHGAPTAINSESTVSITPPTPIGREVLSKPVVGAAVGSQVVASEIDEIARRRVQLMAANYASGKESAEIVARLEILNSRLLEKAPRVTSSQVEALEVANEQLLRTRAVREERARRLGIRV